MTDKPTVTTKDGAGTPSPDAGKGGSAPDELDALMSEFDSEIGKAPSEQDAQQNGDMTEVLSFIREQKAEAAKKDANAGLDDAVKQLQRELGEDTPPMVVKGLLHAFAVDQPGIVKAFEERKSNPTRWERTLRALAPKVREAMGSSVDRSVTQDREAISAAVRGANTTAPEGKQVTAKDVAKMSDKEFAAYQRDIGLVG